jgi:hypothetical protein
MKLKIEKKITQQKKIHTQWAARNTWNLNLQILNCNSRDAKRYLELELWNSTKWDDLYKKVYNGCLR